MIRKIFCFLLSTIMTSTMHAQDTKQSLPTNGRERNVSLQVQLPASLPQAPIAFTYPEHPLEVQISVADRENTLRGIRAHIETKLDLQQVRADVTHNVALPAQIPPVRIQAPDQPIRLGHTLHLAPETRATIEEVTAKCPVATGAIALACNGSPCLSCCLLTCLFVPYDYVKESTQLALNALKKRILQPQSKPATGSEPKETKSS